jgi:hypothetical protein
LKVDFCCQIQNHVQQKTHLQNPSWAFVA